MQNVGHQCAFTSLLEYHTHKENARPHMSLNYFTELQASKGIVLMAGDVDSKILSPKDAQYLVNILQSYYLTTPEKLKLVHTFNKDPKNFDFQKLLEDLDNLPTAADEALRSQSK
jgi:ATP synthase F1 complex assembly factor 1